MATSKRYTVDQTLQLLEDSYDDFDSGDESDLSDDPEFPYPTGSPYHDSDSSDSEKSCSEVKSLLALTPIQVDIYTNILKAGKHFYCYVDFQNITQK